MGLSKHRFSDLTRRTVVTGLARPEPVSESYQREFEEQAASMGLNPDYPWIGGYVDYEWDHLRHILNAYDIDVKGLSILEFGCNVGASSILFSHFGAKVFAVDVAREYVELAHLNARRYGINNIEFHHVVDTRHLPFENDYFDFVCCNSVLEYVDPGHLSAVEAEIGRTVKTGGRILVTGTSNRLWPKEVHSEKWFVNYMPRFVDRIFKLNLERGTLPWKIRYGFGKHYENLDYRDRGRAFVESRALMGGCKNRLQAYVKLMSWLGVGPGLMAQNISCLLEKKISERNRSSE